MTQIAEMNMNTEQPVNKKNRFTLWMIILVFGLPPFAAYFMYYTGLMPSARMNKGTLIQATPLPQLTLTHLDNKPFSYEAFRGKWTMMMMVDESCDQACKKNIYLMRQVRTSLGKDRQNADRLLVVKSPVVVQNLKDFFADYPNLSIVTGDQESISKLDSFFKSLGNSSLNKVFLIDPMGKAMMHYEQDFQPKDLLSDLKRLIMVNANDSSGTMF